MCGIYGIVQPGARAAELRLTGEKANVLQAHRGPDQQGIASEDGWLLAHRRLSIYDVSESGRQPLNYGPDLSIVFNGAIYNFPELREQLRKEGFAFQSQTDTEVILAAYRAWGTGCFARFNGMWALAILDLSRRELVLSRDRIGIKPLYLHRAGGQLSFASEPLALRKTVGRGSELNLGVARDFLVHGWQDHRPESIWAGIRQFPAGHFAVCPLEQPEQLVFTQYYELPNATRQRPEAELKEELNTLLTDSVRLRTRSDVGCGLTLSGGIDSSSIAGLLGPGHRTYSALFPGTPYDEQPFVEAVIRKTGLPNYSLYPSWQDFLAEYEACAAGQDQPLASAAVVIHYRLMRLVQQTGEKVILNGQGADEIGAGYDKFYGPYLREMRRRGTLHGLRATARVASQLRMAPDKLAARLQRLTGNPAPTNFLTNFDQLGSTPFRRSPDTDVLQTSVNLLTEVGLPVLLRHEDRSAMAFGIESRPPFLDYRLVDFLLAAPTDFKLKNGVRKAGIRESLRPFLPEEVYARKRKLGFATPQHRWLEAHAEFFLGPIREYVNQPNALLKPAAAAFAQDVLSRRKTGHYPLVWRWWGWAVFSRGGW